MSVCVVVDGTRFHSGVNAPPAGNAIKEKHLVCLAPALATSTSLTSLSLWGTFDVSDVSAGCIADIIACSTAITDLQFPCAYDVCVGGDCDVHVLRLMLLVLFCLQPLV